jgi:transcriptional regulator with XRE-family HTH domain
MRRAMDKRLTRNSRKVPLHPIPDGRAIHRFVRVIDAAIDARGLNLVDLARKSGVAQSTLCGWRNGSIRPRIDDLEAALNALGFQLPWPEFSEKGETH